ncbi:MAG TPA: TolC family protein [Clostridiaceae bacterium]|nr:TolC family protein [Clostridiaceae bacterium]
MKSKVLKVKVLKKVTFKIAIFLIIMSMINLLSFNVAIAEEENAEELKEDKKQIDITALTSMNLEQAIEIAINNSVQCKIDDINIALKEEALRQAKENATFVGDAYGAERILNNRIIKEVRPFEAEISLEIARKTKEDNINNLKANIKKAVQNLLMAQIEKEVETKRLDILLERYDLMKGKLLQGVITEKDLVDLEFSIENKRMDIVKAGEKIEIAENNIKKFLNLPFESKLIKINEIMKFELIINMDVNKAVTSAINNSTSIYKLVKDIEVKEKILELTGQYFPETNINYITAKYNLEDTKAALDEAKLNLEVSVKNSYSNLLNLSDRVYLAERYLAIIGEKYNLAQIKYKNGLITTDALISAKEALLNAEYQRYVAIYNYNLGKIDFEAMCGLSN